MKIADRKDNSIVQQAVRLPDDISPSAAGIKSSERGEKLTVKVYSAKKYV